MTVYEAFNNWLDGLMAGMKMTRREWANERGINLNDLEWAFSMGWSHGVDHVIMELRTFPN